MKIRRILFYLITVAALIVVYLKFGEFQHFQNAFSASNWYWMVLAAALQATTYLCLSLNYKFVLKIKGLAVSVREMYPVTFIIQFLNQALPSGGISGQFFFIDYLKRKGMSMAQGLARVILELMTLYMAFGFLFVICAFIGIRQERLGHPEIAYFIWTFLAIAFLVMIVYLAFQKDTGSGWLNGLIERFHSRSLGTKKEAVATFLKEIRGNISAEALRPYRGSLTLAILSHLGVLILDIGTLWVLAYAVGTPISISVAFIVFTLTQFASMISFVPGSLGVFEGGMSLLLIAFGMPSDAALTATILFRVLTFWLPMPIGWLLYRLYERRYHAQPIV